MVELKQSTAVTLMFGPFLDDADGKTAETALTITQAEVRLSKNGGNMAQKGEATSLAHDELGYYTCLLNTTDTDTLGVLRAMVHESGALPVWQDFMVVTANYWDSKYSTDYFQVDVVEVSGDSAAADNAEAFFDGTGYAGTNNVIPLVTVATTATNLTNAPTNGDLTATMKASITAAVWDAVIENSKTAIQLIRGIFAFVGNKATGGGTSSVAFRDDADSKDRIVMTVDGSGNRTAVTKDLT